MFSSIGVVQRSNVTNSNSFISVVLEFLMIENSSRI